MPKMSDDTLLRYAIVAAVQDRLTLADAYSGRGEVAEAAVASSARFEALKGKPLARMSDAEIEDARLCFVFGEQYEQSRVDARVEAGRRWREDPKRRAASFREVRLRRWGRTRLEALMDGASSVELKDLQQQDHFAASQLK